VVIAAAPAGDETLLRAQQAREFSHLCRAVAVFRGIQACGAFSGMGARAGGFEPGFAGVHPRRLRRAAFRGPSF